MSEYCCSLFISVRIIETFNTNSKEKKNVWDREDFRTILISDYQKHTTLFMKRNLREELYCIKEMFNPNKRRKHVAPQGSSFW